MMGWMAHDLITRLLSKHQRSQNRWIGLEVERHLRLSQGQMARYAPHLKPLLKSLIQNKGWRVDYEVDGHVLGLMKNLHMISLEPGSQFEFGIAPRKTLQEVAEAQAQLDAELKSLPEFEGMSFLCVGVNPWENADTIEILPSPRYRLMDSYFQSLKGRGREMMRLTCGLQINLDFATEAEGVEMFRAVLASAPYLATAFSNSPFHLGKAAGVLSERHSIWKKTDPKRSGFLEFAFRPDWTFATYSEAVSQIPLMYAYDKSNKVFDPQGASLKSLDPKLQEFNALAAMRQVFTEVRFKPCCVEIRCFDAVEDGLRWAATALCVGLFYDEENRRSLARKADLLTSARAQTLMDEGAKHGLKSDHHFEVIRDLVKQAYSGLVRRGFGEEKFLSALEPLLLTRKTPADVLVEQMSLV
jgi:glutamate--cysteine ligase